MEPVTIAAVVITGLYSGLVTFLGGEAARERDEGDNESNSNSDRDDDER